MRHIFSSFGALFGFLLACSSGGGGTPDAGPTDSGKTSLLGFTPSNFDVNDLDFTNVGDIVESTSRTWETDHGLLGSDNSGNYNYKEVTQLASPLKLGIFTVKSLTIQAGVTIRVEGADALVIVALDRIDIQGSLYGNSQFMPAYFLGPGAVTDPTAGNSAGVGAGGGGSGSGDSSGAGAGYCGKGGKGASETPGGGAQGGGFYGLPNIIPLVAGSAGGSGFGGGGAGGGAIQLVAANTIIVSGKIHVGGEGGYSGGVYNPGSSQEASGGGSGGSILMESAVVETSGTLAANGGGGGQGPGTWGADATPDATAAKGGNDGTHGSLGGDGSSSSGTDGEDGNVTPGTVAGGGGGAAGRIRVNTMSGSATLGGIISPSSICTTQGTVMP